MPDQPIDHILFDVGRVLVQLNPWTASFPEDVFPREGLFEKVEIFVESSSYLEYEEGLIDSAAFLERVREHYGVEGSDDELSAYFCRQLGDVMPGMDELIDDLLRNDVRLTGFSNTTEIHAQRLPAYSTVAKLERLITSCGIRARKPEARSYTLALEELGAEAATTLFVDDKEENIVGAQKAGLRALQFTDTMALRVDLGRLGIL